MDRAGLIPSLAKEGWREAPGWFEAAILQLRSDFYSCFIEWVLPAHIFQEQTPNRQESSC